MSVTCKKRSGTPGSAIRVRGFFRIKLGEDRNGKTKIVGDSGWKENTVVNDGFDQYIVRSLGAIAGSKTVAYVNLGTGTAPNATHTALDGETGTRKTTSNSVVASKTMQSTCAFGSTDHPGGTPSIRNIGLFNTDSGGTMLCGNTYGTSAWNSNQAVSITYQLRFS
jgi:hypothetical protein